MTPSQQRFAVIPMAAALLFATGSSNQASKPSHAQILAAVTSSLAAQIGTTADRIDPDAKFSSLNPRPDELDIVELIMTLEEKFGIEITDDAVARAVGSPGVDALGTLSVRSLSKIVSDALD